MGCWFPKVDSMGTVCEFFVHTRIVLCLLMVLNLFFRHLHTEHLVAQGWIRLHIYDWHELMFLMESPRNSLNIPLTEISNQSHQHIYCLFISFCARVVALFTQLFCCFSPAPWIANISSAFLCFLHRQGQLNRKEFHFNLRKRKALEIFWLMFQIFWTFLQ